MLEFVVCEIVQEGLQVLSLCLSLLGTLLLTSGLQKVERIKREGERMVWRGREKERVRKNRLHARTWVGR